MKSLPSFRCNNKSGHLVQWQISKATAVPQSVQLVEETPHTVAGRAEFADIAEIDHMPVVHILVGRNLLDHMAEQLVVDTGVAADHIHLAACIPRHLDCYLI